MNTITGESERDRRLRLRAEERARRGQGSDKSAYEIPQNLPSESSKRDMIWEMKKAQRLGGAPNTSAIPQPDPFSAFPNQPKVLQEAYEIPALPQSPQKFDSKTPNQGFQEYPVQIEKPYPLYQQPDNQYKADPFIANYDKNIENIKNQYPDVGVTKEQQQYADYLFTELTKKNNDEANGMRGFAQNVERRVEEKPQGVGNEALDFGFEIGSNRKGLDKKQYAAELEAQIRAKKGDRAEDFSQGGYFGGVGTQMSEREKKLKYAKELEAQIKQKKQEDSFNKAPQEDFFPVRQDNSRDKKRQYAEELQAQIRDKNKNFFSNPPNPPSTLPFQNYEKAPTDFYQRGDLKPIDEIPTSLAKYPDQGTPRNTGQADDKKLKYRQELEKQIEDQKRRKEEEKRRLKQDEEKAEKRFTNDSGIDYGKPIARHKTIDPNKPSEDNPQAERYKEHISKAKSGSKGDVYSNFEEPYKNPSPGPTQIEKPRNADFPPSQQDKRENIFDPRPFPQAGFNQYDSSDPINAYKRHGLGDFPTNYSPQFTEENQMKIYERENPGEFRQENMMNNYLADEYLREIQQIRLERNRAREECLEMREMVLREKERNLEQMMFMLKNQGGDFRPGSFPEPRPGMQQDKPFVYSVNRNLPVENYYPTSFQNEKYALAEGNPYGKIPEQGIARSDPYSDMYKHMDPYAKPMDPYAKPMDPYTKPMDPYGKGQDFYRPAEDFRAQGMYGKINDGYSNAYYEAEIPIKPLNPINNAPDNYKPQKFRTEGYSYDPQQDIIVKNPKSSETAPNMLEMSLAGESKWVTHENIKWGDVKLIESICLPEEKPETKAKPRNKWDSNELPSDALPERKNPTPTPLYLSNNKSSQLMQIYVDDESLPSKIEHLPYPNPECQDFESSHNNSIQEEIESSSDQKYTESEREEQEKSIEQTREITLSNPKYEELEEHVIDCDNWSEEHSEAEVEARNRQIKNSYDKPRTIDIFAKKPSVKADGPILNKENPKTIWQTRDADLEEFNKKPEPRPAIKPNPPHGRVAFSRLEEARKNAKEQKVRDNFEEIDDLTSQNLDQKPYKISVESSIEGRLTKQALNELRKQKRQSNEDSFRSKASIEDSYKSPTSQDRDVFLKNFFNLPQASKEPNISQKPPVRPVSRRYQD